MNKQQLAALIWNSCDDLRGSISAVEYKDVILGLIFYRFVSEKEVTQDYHYMDSGAVRASSIMFFHKRGTPQEVYKEFGQLGVLDWNKIRKLKVLSVFLFDSTVSFINPINVSNLRKLVAEIQDKKLQLQGPHHITDELSQRILITAMEETSCTI